MGSTTTMEEFYKAIKENQTTGLKRGV